MSNGNSGVSYTFIIFIVIFAVFLATGSSYFMFSRLVSGDDAVELAEGQKEELGPTVNLDQFIVNLGADRSFAQVNIVFEVSNSDVIDEINERTPQIRDEIISILRGKSLEDINQPEGPRELREEMMQEINKILMEGRVTNVFFTEFVIQ